MYGLGILYQFPYLVVFCVYIHFDIFAPPSSQAIIAKNFSSQISPKQKSEGNYSSCRAQVTNLLFGYDLFGHLDHVKR